MTNQTQKFTDTIVQGQRVHCILYGGKDGIVVGIHGEQSPATCESLHGVVVTGGSADFDIIWDNGSQSRRVPESLVRSGIQWTVYPDVATPDDIINAWEASRLFDAHATAKADAKAAQEAEDRKGHLIDNPHLLPCEPGAGTRNDRKLAAKNIRIALKKRFPGTKFSVTTDYDSVSIGWTDGPSADEVKPLTDRHSSGTFDAYTDCQGWADNAFGQVFGEVRYIWNNRQTSDEAAEAVARDYCKAYGVDFENLNQTVRHDSLHTISRNILHHHSIPVGHHVTGCEKTEVRSGCAADYHKFFRPTTAPTDPEVVAEKAASKKAPTFTDKGLLSTSDYPNYPRSFRSEKTAQKAADAAIKAGHDCKVVRRFRGRNQFAVELIG